LNEIKEHAMGADLMGRVLTEATVENLEDLYVAKRGAIPSEEVRRIVIDDALVDTGATLLSLPSSMIRQLGLEPVVKKRVTGSNGPAESWLYSSVRLTIQDRFCTIDVLEVPDGVPPLIGQIPLEQLDFVVDLRNHRLIGNPAHGGEHVLELY
jgi:predicted aspartyl protease